MVDEQDGTAEENEKKSRDRSPNHPILSLSDALEKAQALHTEYGRHLVPVGRAHVKWGYKEHSGIGNQCVAALKSYGLLDVDGQAKERKLELTDRADRIIRNAPDRQALLEAAANEPAIHREILAEYGDKGLPPDDILRRYLVWERKGGRFNESVVDSFIKRFRATLEFAGLDIGAATNKKTPVDSPKNGNGKDPSPQVRVGSYVQWTSDGQHRFPAPLPVVGISEDGDWAFVEGSQSGLPMSELTVETPPAPAAPKLPPANPFFKPVDDVDKDGVARERMTLDEGPVKLEWPDELSAESVGEFEYWLNGLIKRAKRKAGITATKRDPGPP